LKKESVVIKKSGKIHVSIKSIQDSGLHEHYSEKSNNFSGLKTLKEGDV
jgi:hypothetical protein